MQHASKQWHFSGVVFHFNQMRINWAGLFINIVPGFIKNKMRIFSSGSAVVRAAIKMHKKVTQINNEFINVDSFFESIYALFNLDCK